MLGLRVLSIVGFVATMVTPKMTIAQEQQLWTAVIAVLVAMPALILAATSLLQSRGQQAQINKNTASAAKHEEQLNGTMDHRIEKVVDARVSDPNAQGALIIQERPK